jgi:magnesium transporter
MNCKGALHCITDLLSNDEDMINLLLTEKANAKANNEVLPVECHEKVELMLEEYARQLKSVLLEIGYLLQRVQSKQDMMALQLDAYRNRMIRMNLYLTMGGISLGFGTAVAGFFGMNVINGFENADGIFNMIVASSTMLGVTFTGACYSYINGSRTKQRTIDNLQEIEVMNRALGDMPALDLSFEMMLAENKPITREEFRKKIFASEPESINLSACDFLFDMLDYNDDDVIDKNDFRILS